MTDDDGRTARLGALLGCPPCDRGELPDGLRLVRLSSEWDEQTMPSGLGRAHRLAAGTWGRIVVHEGRLRFSMSSEPPLEVEVGPCDTQAIPPDVQHVVHPLGPVRFQVEFHAASSSGRLGPSGVDSDHHERTDEPVVVPTPEPAADEGGEDACWLHLCCPECGAMLDGGPHRAGCSSQLLG